MVIGLAKFQKKTEKNIYPGLTRNLFSGKSSQNSPTLVLICLDSIPCVFCLNIEYVIKGC